MRVYRSSYRDRHGKPQKTAKWYIEFRDPRHAERKLRRLPAFTDKGASLELGRKLVKLAEFRAAGEQPDVPLRRWLEAMPPGVRKEVQRLGLLAGETIEGHRPIADHLADYQRSMEGDARAPRHVKWTVSQVQKVIDGCGFVFLSDVSPEPIKTFVAELAAGSDGIKSRSFNGYVTAMKSFINWLVKDGRMASSPLAQLHKRKITDETERRALTMDEARLLLAITEAAPERFGMTGPERALAYRLSLETGLRANEIASLKRSSFELTSAEPAVKIAAAPAKKRKAARTHLSADTAAALLAHPENKLPAVAAFNLPDSTHTAEMIRGDCADARTAWIAAAPRGQKRVERESDSFLADVDEAGRVLVFHSLRHTRGRLVVRTFRSEPAGGPGAHARLVDRHGRSVREEL